MNAAPSSFALGAKWRLEASPSNADIGHEENNAQAIGAEEREAMMPLKRPTMRHTRQIMPLNGRKRCRVGQLVRQ